MVLDMIKTLEMDEGKSSEYKPGRPTPKEHLDSLLLGSKSKIYQKLVERPVCDRVPVPRPNGDNSI